MFDRLSLNDVYDTLWLHLRPWSAAIDPPAALAVTPAPVLYDSWQFLGRYLGVNFFCARARFLHAYRLEDGPGKTFDGYGADGV